MKETDACFIPSWSI